MPKENDKSKSLAIFFWVCVGLCMAAIFYFSSQSADISARQSGFIRKIVESIFGISTATDFVVRKLAHFSEFLGLSLLANTALYFTCGRTRAFWGTAISSAYAITDEVHQIFVDGRSCQFTDWLIDTAGAVTGLVIFLIIYIFIGKIILPKQRNRRNKK